MPSVQNDNVIILARKQYGEADLIVTFFGEEQGRQSGIAKSSLVSSRRFGGGLEPGTITEISFRKSKGKLLFIEESFVSSSAVTLMKSGKRILFLMRVLELALAFLPEGQIAGKRYKLLKRYIEYLSQNEPQIGDGVSFDLNWIKLSGFAPILSHCCYCGVKTYKNWTIVSSEGAISCEACAKSRALKAPLSDELRLNMKDSMSGKNVKWPKSGMNVVEAQIDNYITYILGRPLTGRSIIQDVMPLMTEVSTDRI